MNYKHDQHSHRKTKQPKTNNPSHAPTKKSIYYYKYMLSFFETIQFDGFYSSSAS